MTNGKKIALAALVMAVASAHPALYAQMGRRSGGDGSVRAAIEAANKKHFIDAAPKGDATLIAGVYTEDAVAYPANSDAVKGRAALQAMWKSVLESGITGFDLVTGEVETAGDMAWETGTYAMTLKDGTVADRGKYVVIWTRVNGEWKIHRDIWTTSLPAAK
ncbi:MAG TPA: DUF4440 domain-containing protein [Vicinamibacterales bacterium]